MADFISCRVWNKQAENFVNYQSKGSLIAVFGELRVDNYEDKEGNRRSKTYILVNSIEFLESKKEPLKENILKEEKLPTNKFEEFGQELEITDEDLPF